MATTPFDLHRIPDDGWKRRYLALLKRYEDQAQFIAADYGFADKRIGVTFDEVDHANASVDLVADGYAIGIASSFPYLLKALFSRLMADPAVMPHVPMAGAGALPDFPIAYAVNANRIGDQLSESVNTHVARERIAMLLSDLAMEFVFLHETAHILCGHVDAKAHRTPDGSPLAELSLTRRGDGKAVARSRAWECEADLIGANLLKTYVDTLIRSTQSPDDISPGLIDPNEPFAEQWIALTVAALYGLFRFLRGTSDTLDLAGFHPDPFLRALAVRGALCQAMMARHDLDKAVLEELIGTRLLELLQAMDRLGMPSGMDVADEAPESLGHGLNDVFANRAVYAPELRPYRYFEWN